MDETPNTASKSMPFSSGLFKQLHEVPESVAEIGILLTKLFYSVDEEFRQCLRLSSVEASDKCLRVKVRFDLVEDKEIVLSNCGLAGPLVNPSKASYWVALKLSNGQRGCYWDSGSIDAKTKALTSYVNADEDEEEEVFEAAVYAISLQRPSLPNGSDQEREDSSRADLL